MANNKSYKEIGEELEASVKEGIRTGDYSKISKVVTKSVETVISDVGDKVINSFETVEKKTTSSYVNGSYTKARQEQCSREINEKRRKAEEERQRRQAARKPRNSSVVSGSTSPAVYHKTSELTSTLLTVGGGIGLGVSLFSAIVSLPVMIINASFGGLLTAGAFAVLSTFLLYQGSSKKKENNFVRKISDLAGEKGYLDITELVRATGLSAKKAVSTVKKLLKKGYFPQGRIDDTNSTLMLTDKVYEQYTASQKYRESAQSDNIIDTTGKFEDDSSQELNQMIARGNDYINRLRNLNDKIPGQVITEKLTKLELLLNDIFKRVKEHPEQMSKMDELMDYYLPTMIKLVDAYEEYDKVSAPGKDIIEAKKDIENTLDTINVAFSKLLNNLFKESVLDVTTDAQVLKTMLAQKGLSTGMEGE